MTEICIMAQQRVNIVILGEKVQGLHLGSLGGASRLTSKLDSDWLISKKALGLKAPETS